ncbi:DUF1269 domain-containing protein [Pseudonocardia broussonetiae]|uniref:DUF1269 domain-containing protein n=1 Tax=Pseudonocardia broussonetiae TaxID=2736640 RepID=A0A6M6JRD0_9PSEU|nr:DUF1269 domain-containing protein [Pseudonocardia broussonetiae]QJY49202.1 DUF1269 domain-containing protein [Pseudonocardia broussonetiae]
MATLTVWKFDTAEGAGNALTTLQGLQKEELVRIVDAAVLTWPADRKKPKTEQLRNLTGAGALGGAFWGMLFGLIFFVPFLGMAVGAAMGALTGAMADVGIDDGFIRSVREKVTPGTSALFVMTSDTVTDRVIESFRDSDPELISTNLSADQEAKLREAFEEEESERV